MNLPAYPAARAVARRVQVHFARHLAQMRPASLDDVAAQPDADTIETVIDAAFWASLRREEGYAPKISLAFLSPGKAGMSLMLERPLPLTPESLTHLAPAVERAGIHLGVWREQNGLFVWGTTRIIPTLCLVLEVVAPGLLVIKHRRAEDSGKFINVAVLEGDQIKVLDENAASLPDCPGLVGALLRFESPATAGSISVLTELAVSMRAHGRGGSLLVVPADTADWRESIMEPIPYPVSPPFSELADLMRAETGEKEDRRWQDAFYRVIAAIAGLTAVDGATVISDRYELLAFGAKIRRREGFGLVEQVLMTEPVEGAAAAVANPGQVGGTRHLSAAQFGHDQRNSLALVASQDGRFTVFAWSPCEGMVHAHRVEALLL